MSKSLRGGVVGSLIVVVGWVLIVLSMVIVATLQISGAVVVSPVWWLVMALMLPAVTLVGATVQVVVVRRARLRLEAEAARAADTVYGRDMKAELDAFEKALKGASE